MRVYRGRLADADRDRAGTATMLARAGRTGEAALRVWSPHRQVAFGPRDVRAAGYETARAAARRRGYATVERSVGGRAVAYSGTTVAFAHALPLAGSRVDRSLEERYAGATTTLVDTLRDLGVDARRGEPPASYCPGAHSVRVAGGGKVAGVAQRVRSDAALVAGCVLVTDRRDLADVLAAVYDALDVAFDPGTVATVSDASGPADPPTVVRSLERAFAGDDRTVVEDADELEDGGR
jgi:lipoate-protein ligase A